MGGKFGIRTVRMHARRTTYVARRSPDLAFSSAVGQSVGRAVLTARAYTASRFTDQLRVHRDGVDGERRDERSSEAVTCKLHHGGRRRIKKAQHGKRKTHFEHAAPRNPCRTAVQARTVHRIRRALRSSQKARHQSTGSAHVCGAGPRSTRTENEAADLQDVRASKEPVGPRADVGRICDDLAVH